MHNFEDKRVFGKNVPNSQGGAGIEKKTRGQIPWQEGRFWIRTDTDMAYPVA
jgi:hypothetical protein